jgi:hypothetical protein
VGVAADRRLPEQSRTQRRAGDRPVGHLGSPSTVFCAGGPRPWTTLRRREVIWVENPYLGPRSVSDYGESLRGLRVFYVTLDSSGVSGLESGRKTGHPMRCMG